MQRYLGGNVDALAAVSDGSRNVGTLYGYDSVALSPTLTVSGGAEYARYDYLKGRSLFSPRLDLTFTPAERTRVSVGLSQRARPCRRVRGERHPHRETERRCALVVEARQGLRYPCFDARGLGDLLGQPCRQGIALGLGLLQGRAGRVALGLHLAEPLLGLFPVVVPGLPLAFESLHAGLGLR